MRSVRLLAYAKINLCLHVLGRRPDGYHELRTVFQTISLHDTLTLELTPRRGIELTCSDPELSTGPENLVWRALEAARRAIGFRGGIRAHLEKRIPVARGLAGGSSDAAAALVGMLRLAGKSLRLERLVELAAGLGADVPFFLFGGTALGVGRGDEVYPLPGAPRRTVVVVSPSGLGVSTKQAYAWLGARLTKRASPPKLHGFCALCWSPQGARVANDFEPAVFARYRRLGQLKQRLLQGGAAEASLAGSGSAVFGLFQNPAKARRIARQFHEDQVFVVETLDRQRFLRGIGWNPTA